MGNVLCHRNRNSSSTKYKPKPKNDSTINLREHISSTINSNSGISIESSESWNILEGLYIQPSNETLTLTMEHVKITKDVIHHVHKEYLIKNKTGHIGLINMDQGFSSAYEDFAKHSPIKPISSRLKERKRMHTYCMLHLYKNLVNWYETQPEKAKNMLKLIAISHYLMRVLPNDFRMMNVLVGKLFLRDYSLDNTVINAVMLFLNSTMNIITDILIDKSNAVQDCLLYEGTQPMFNKKARENYRAMKQWHKFVLDFRNELNAEYILQLDMQICSISNLRERPLSKYSSKYKDFLQ